MVASEERKKKKKSHKKAVALAPDATEGSADGKNSIHTISGAKLRDGFEMHSADAGSLDPGQVVDALEGMFLNSKTYYE